MGIAGDSGCVRCFCLCRGGKHLLPFGHDRHHYAQRLWGHFSCLAASNAKSAWAQGVVAYDFSLVQVSLAELSVVNAALSGRLVPSDVSPGLVVLDDQNAVANPVSGTQQFYRLNQ